MTTGMRAAFIALMTSLLLVTSTAFGQDTQSDKECLAFAAGQPEHEAACMAATADQPMLRDYWRGRAHLFYQGKMFDPDAGLKEMERASNGGQMPEADVILALAYYRGEIGPRDYKQTRFYANRAAQKGMGMAWSLMGALMQQGQGGFKLDVDRAVNMYFQAASHGFPQALIQIGDIYYFGSGIPADRKQALTWYEEAKGFGVALADSRIARATKELNVTNLQAQGQGNTPTVTVSRGNAPAIPPSLDPTGEWAVLYARPFEQSRDIVDELKSRQGRLHPSLMLELARRMAMLDRPEAYAVYVRAFAQLQYDVRRCTDRTAAGAQDIFKVLYGRALPAWMARDRSIGQQYGLPALLDPQIDQNSNNHWVCYHGVQAMLETMKGQAQENWQKPKDEWPAIYRSIVTAMKKSAERIQGHQK